MFQLLARVPDIFQHRAHPSPRHISHDTGRGGFNFSPIFAPILGCGTPRGFRFQPHKQLRMCWGMYEQKIDLCWYVSKHLTYFTLFGSHQLCRKSMTLVTSSYLTTFTKTKQKVFWFNFSFQNWSLSDTLTKQDRIWLVSKHTYDFILSI